MKLTIVAATGGIGRQLLTQALTAGHQVTAVVRDPGRLAADVPAVVTDLAAPDGSALATAVKDADAVLSGLGPRRRDETGVASNGTRALVEAMQAQSVRRLALVSAAPIGTVPLPGRPQPPRHDPGDSLVMRHVAVPLLKWAFRDAYLDLARMEELVRDSGLDWTIVRPPRLTNAALTGTYRTTDGRNLRRGWSVSRPDVAHFLLRLLDQPETVGRTIGIAR